MELAKIKVKAKEVFKFNPEAKKLIGVTDGSFFLPAAKNLAQDHARKTGHKLFEIDRELNSTHPGEAADKLAKAEKLAKAKADEAAAEKLAKADAVVAEKAKAKAKADEAAAKAKAEKFAENAKLVAEGAAVVDLKESTIKAVTDWAAKQTDVAVLELADKTVDTKGGHKVIAERIKELKNA